MNKMYKNITPVKDELIQKIITKARNEVFPLEKLSAELRNWYKAIAHSQNTRPEFVLLASITTVAAIVGPKTKIQIRAGSNKTIQNPRKAYTESSGLFLTILCEPGSGKSNAFDLAVQDPIVSQEDELLKSLLIQDYTKKGLFESLKSHNGMGLLASSEMMSFFDQLMRKQMDGYGERNTMNLLYDGNSNWIMTSAGRKQEDGKEKREELNKTSFSITGFAQPEPFIQSFRPLAATRDGFTDRLLVCTVKPELLKEVELDSWNEKLDQYDLQSFHLIYKEIFKYHVNGVVYKYSPEAQQLFAEYSDMNVEEANEIWKTGALNNHYYSKDKRNLSRLALNLHILTATIKKFLNCNSEEEMTLENGDLPINISKETFLYAQAVMEYFRSQREILNMVFLKSKGENNENLDIQNLQMELFRYLENVLQEKNYSDFILVRDDGIVIRLQDAPNFPIKIDHLTTWLEKKGFSKQNKAYYFNKVRKRGVSLPWGAFTAEEVNKLKTAVGEVNKLKTAVGEASVKKTNNDISEGNIGTSTQQLEVVYDDDYAYEDDIFMEMANIQEPDFSDNEDQPDHRPVRETPVRSDKENYHLTLTEKTVDTRKRVKKANDLRDGLSKHYKVAGPRQRKTAK